MMRRYSVSTWDHDLAAFTPQEGIVSPCINVDLHGVRRAVRELRQSGYEAHRVRLSSGEYVCDSSVLVERIE